MTSGGVKVLGGRLTVSAEPFFWLMSGIMGMSFGRGSISEVVLWAAVVAFSVLFHELGHAAVCLTFGSGADITLHGMGGSTRPRNLKAFGTWRTALLNLAGCIAGTALAVAAFATIYAAGALNAPLTPVAKRIAVALIEINIWFSLFNLLPIMPMDGGKFVSGLLRAAWGVNGERIGHALGLTLGAAAALYFYRVGAMFGALLCGAMAAGEGRALKRSLSMTAADADETFQEELPRAARLWEGKKREEAVEALKALREKTKAGLIYGEATLQLGFYLYVMDRDAEAYELFKLVPDGDMPAAALRAYAEVALGRKDFETALRLGRTNFHNEPGAQTAAAIAIAAAGLGDARETVSWLRTALRHGLDPAELKAKEFDPVRNTEEFKELVDGLAR